jgi:hypothetical protein
MKKAIWSIALFSAFAFAACGGGDTAVVESGTYEGKVAEVKPEEKEIYVNYQDKKLELYFTDSTELTRQGKQVDFNKLKKDQKVKVKLEKRGKKLNPLKVEILK